MLNVPVVVLLGAIVLLLLLLRAARPWVIVLALAFGLYAANTQFGKDVKKGGDTVVTTVNQHQPTGTK